MESYEKTLTAGSVRAWSVGGGSYSIVQQERAGQGGVGPHGPFGCGAVARGAWWRLWEQSRWAPALAACGEDDLSEYTAPASAIRGAWPGRLVTLRRISVPVGSLPDSSVGGSGGGSGVWKPAPRERRRRAAGPERRYFRRGERFERRGGRRQRWRVGRGRCRLPGGSNGLRRSLRQSVERRGALWPGAGGLHGAARRHAALPSEQVRLPCGNLMRCMISASMLDEVDHCGGCGIRAHRSPARPASAQSSAMPATRAAFDRSGSRGYPE
jgi:hypothetical protein